jgi:hypothetical protein
VLKEDRPLERSGAERASAVMDISVPVLVLNNKQRNKKNAETPSRVDRWYILRPKIPIWVYFGGLWSGKRWYILWSFGKF